MTTLYTCKTCKFEQSLEDMNFILLEHKGKLVAHFICIKCHHDTFKRTRSTNGSQQKQSIPPDDLSSNLKWHIYKCRIHIKDPNVNPEDHQFSTPPKLHHPPSYPHIILLD